VATSWEDSMAYHDKIVRPELELAFKKIADKYKKVEEHPRIKARHPADDIRHMREIHVDVSLREAEDCADVNNIEMALRNIECAIGYLVILHRRTREKRTEYENQQKLLEGMKDEGSKQHKRLF